MTLYLRQIWKDERLSYTSYNRRLAIDIIAETVLLLLLITVMVVVVVVGIIVVVFCYSVFVFVDTLFIYTAYWRFWLFLCVCST